MPTKLSAKFQSVIFIALIVILGLLVYFNSLGGAFIWDDAGLIKGNLYIRSWSNLPKIFTSNIWAGIGENSTVFRPLQIVTYLADYSIWNLDPRGYHLTNILLHILAALSLYWFINLLFKQRVLALFSSLLFVCHPVHVEAVSYISGRADPLAAIFILLAFIFYLKFLETKRTADWVITLLSFIFALLSRENAVILPVLLLIYHYAFKKKLEIKPFLSIAAIAAGYIIFRLVFMKTLFYDLPVESTLMQRLPGCFAALANYFRILFLPINLHMEYGNIFYSFLAPATILGLAIILFLLLGVLKSKKSDAIVLFSLLWFIAAFLPVSNLYPLNAYMAEHWLYLPSIGFFIIIAALFSRWFEKNKIKPVVLGLFISLLLSYAYLTVKQNAYWRSEFSFFKRTLFYAPGSTKVYYNLGNLYCAAGDNAQGISMYLKAVELNPRYAEAYNNIGGTYIVLGNNQEGIKYCQLALEINPRLSAAYYNLGNAYYNLGQKDKSVEMVKKSIEFNPVYVDAYNNLAAGYAEAGDVEAAINLWNKCVKLDPDFATGHFNLAVFYFNSKNYSLAVKHCDRVIALGGQVDPKFLEALRPFRQSK